jgi:AcrR family transcriptional regulator
MVDENSFGVLRANELGPRESGPSELGPCELGPCELGPSARGSIGFVRGTSRHSNIAVAYEMHQRRPAATIRVADIARAAGVSASLIIAHFKSKDELLFEAFLDWFEAKLVPDLTSWAQGHPDAGLSEVLVRVFHWVGRPLHRSRDIMASSYWWTAPEAERRQRVMTPVQDLVIAKLRAAAPQARPQDLAAAEQMVQASFEACLRAAGIESMNQAAVRRLLARLCQPALEWLTFKQRENIV